MALNSKDTHGYTLKNKEILSLSEIRGDNKSEALKSSNNIGVIVEGCHIYGGNEDCLDIVRGEAKIINTKFYPENSQQAVTIKGSALVYLRNCKIYGNPKGYDFSIGDFTIYDAVQENRMKTKVVLQNCKAVDSVGKPRSIKIKVIHGDCEVYNTKSKVRKFPAFLVKIYFKIMRWLISKERRNEALSNLVNSPDR